METTFRKGVLPGNSAQGINSSLPLLLVPLVQQCKNRLEQPHLGHDHHGDSHHHGDNHHHDKYSCLGVSTPLAAYSRLVSVAPDGGRHRTEFRGKGMH